jgi:molecular chaperone DnaJ
MPTQPPIDLQTAIQTTRRLIYLGVDPVMLMARDYYSILGLPEDASVDQVRAAVRELLFALDPGNPPFGLTSEEVEAGETLALLLTEIEDCLCDPTRRAAYDAQRQAQASRG